MLVYAFCLVTVCLALLVLYLTGWVLSAEAENEVLRDRLREQTTVVVRLTDEFERAVGLR